MHTASVLSTGIFHSVINVLGKRALNYIMKWQINETKNSKVKIQESSVSLYTINNSADVSL